MREWRMLLNPCQSVTLWNAFGQNQECKHSGSAVDVNLELVNGAQGASRGRKQVPYPSTCAAGSKAPLPLSPWIPTCFLEPGFSLSIPGLSSGRCEVEIVMSGCGHVKRKGGWGRDTQKALFFLTLAHLCSFFPSWLLDLGTMFHLFWEHVHQGWTNTDSPISPSLLEKRAPFYW